MGYDPIVVSLAARNAVREVRKNGGTGYTEIQRNPAIEPVVVSAGSTGKNMVKPYADHIILGAKYIVTINSAKYEATLYKINDNYYLGNASLYVSAQQNTGEKYCVQIRSLTSGTPANGVKLSEPATEDTTVTVELINETIHPIDPKYLPGVCLPVVELSTTFESGASYTAEENAKLKAVWDSGTPVVIKCPVAVSGGSFDTTSFVWNRVFDSKMPSMYIYVYFYGSYSLQIISVDYGETWGCTVDKMG